MVLPRFRADFQTRFRSLILSANTTMLSSHSVLSSTISFQNLFSLSVRTFFPFCENRYVRTQKYHKIKFPSKFVERLENKNIFSLQSNAVLFQETRNLATLLQLLFIVKA